LLIRFLAEYPACESAKGINDTFTDLTYYSVCYETDLITIDIVK